jgi:cytochrome c biogenesis protein ResB
MRFARGLLMTIGCLALVGTLIPQQEAPATYLTRFGPSGAHWLTGVGLTDLYHSWYFASLFALLGASLIVCSLRRFAVNLKTLGSIALHLSFLLIIAGGVIRQVAGIEGVVELREGERTIQLKLTETTTRALPFAVHLEDFSLERYSGNPQAVSEFTSHVRLIDVGANTQAVVRVNHPIVHQGFRIYQLGYNPDDPAWTALLLVKDPGIPIVYTGFGLLLVGLITTLHARLGGVCGRVGGGWIVSQGNLGAQRG